MDNFDEFIESNKQKKYINYFDFVHIINACNIHYYENRYDEFHFSGIHPQKKRKHAQKSFNNYYGDTAGILPCTQCNGTNEIGYRGACPSYQNRDMFHCDQTTTDMLSPWTPLYNDITSSCNSNALQSAQREFQNNLGFAAPPTLCNRTNSLIPKPFIEQEQEKEKKIDKIKKQIDFNVESLDDLLKLIEHHPYSEEYEYNIDLKGLHNIEPELKKLNGMIGIKSLKNSVLNQLIYFIQQPILGNTNDFKHTIICGPPGTGKTEIAKILGQMYCKIGVLKTNIFKKVTRNDLVAGYLGQTAIKTKDVINSCLGGCLFLDEAYSLGGGDNTDSFAKECVDILCEALSDHKEDLMVIVAGYEDDLKNHFFSINKGLESRFIWKFNMEDYTSKDMVDIFEKKVRELEWELNTELSNKRLVEWIDNKKENFKHFGRDIEILLSHCKICHSRRVYGKSSELLKKITMEDLESGYKYFLENGKKKHKELYCSLYL
jgi:SpoVK/Ycf46/Vps4 family AAA+-type ATPase